MRKRLSFFGIIGFWVMGFVAMGFMAIGPVAAAPSSVCDRAAAFAAEKTGVPLSILRAVTLAETGHSKGGAGGFTAWPWAVQSGNRGNWFGDAAAAIAHVEGLLAQGTRNIDVGCFQINIRWHGAEFDSLESMMTPETNALYAARFLQQLYQETGDWRQAVGRYHSRDDDLAEAYVQRLETLFNTHLATAPSITADAPEIAAPRRQPPQRYSLVMARGPLIEMPRTPRPLIGGTR